MPQPKDKDWLNRYKNNTPIYAIYKRPHLRTSDTYRLKVKGWKKIFQANGDEKKNNNNQQHRLLYPARISFKYEGEIKSFTNKQKLREFSTTKPALKQMLKDLL